VPAAGAWWELLLWQLALSSPWCMNTHALIINEIAIVALFALSLDIILGLHRHRVAGPCGLLRHGRLYSAALFAKHINPDPLFGLASRMAVSTVLGAVAV